MTTAPPLTDATRLPVTVGLAALAIAVTLAGEMGRDVSVLYMREEAFWREPWRLLTSILPHGGVLHLLFNVYWLWVLGGLVERAYGHLALLGAAAFFAVTSGAAEYAFSVGGIGLSGVGYGLVGFTGTLSRRQSRIEGAVGRRTVELFVAWFFLCIVLTVTDVMNIGNVAHGAGAIAGVLLGLVVAPQASRVRVGAAIGLLAFGAASVAAASVGRARLNFSGDVDREASIAAQKAFDDGRYEDALSSYQRAAELDPDDPRNWYNVGVTHSRLDDEENARAAYRRAHEIDPANEGYRLAYARATVRASQAARDAEQLEQAATLARDAARLAPELGSAWRALAFAEEDLGHAREASEAYRRVTELEPEDAGNWFNLGLHHQRRGQYPAAREAYERAVELAPDDRRFAEGLAHLLVRMGNDALDREALRDAITHYRAALEHAPQTGHAWHNLGVAHGRLGEEDEANRAFAQAKAIDPTLGD